MYHGTILCTKQNNCFLTGQILHAKTLLVTSRTYVPTHRGLFDAFVLHDAVLSFLRVYPWEDDIIGICSRCEYLNSRIFIGVVGFYGTLPFEPLIVYMSDLCADYLSF